VLARRAHALAARRLVASPQPDRAVVHRAHQLVLGAIEDNSGGPLRGWDTGVIWAPPPLPSSPPSYV
jgi:hypothetical protein